MNANKNLKGVLITGAADRLGLEIAKECRALGYAVILHFRSSAEPAAEAFKDDGDVFFIRAELSVKPIETIRKMMDEAAALPVTLEGLVNNAASFQPGDMWDPEHLRELMKTNTLAPLAISSRFARIVKSGWIINITDARVKQLNKRYQNYRTSKLFLDEITRQLAFLHAPGIRVNAIAPGMVLPPKLGSAESQYGSFDPRDPQEQLEKLTRSIPLARVGSAENIRQTVRFLIENDYITGAVIPVDGGWHLS